MQVEFFHKELALATDCFRRGDNLRKGLTILGILFIILTMFGEFILPNLLASTLQKHLSERLATHDVVVNLSSAPNFMTAAGHVDHLRVIAHSAKLGEIYVDELLAEGEGVRVDIPRLVSDGVLEIRSTDQLALRGIVTELNLKELISRRVEKLENVQVKITPEAVLVTANIKVFGRMADAEMTGVVLEDSGALYFRMTKLQVKNVFPGKLSLDNFFGDIQIVKPDKLPLGAKFEQVEMQDGKVMISAGRKSPMVTEQNEEL